MHKYLTQALIVIGIFIGYVSVNAQNEPWSFELKHGVNAKIETEHLRDLYFYDAEYGWATGRRGLIKHTRDGGLTWVEQKSPKPVDLGSVTFVSRDRGWIVGIQGTVLSTKDGGTTWVDKSIQEVQSFIRYVHFIDAENGWIAAAEGRFSTTEGGISWSKISDPSDWRSITAIHFEDKLYGRLLLFPDGESFKSRLLITDDGGFTWKESQGFEDSVYRYGVLASITFYDTDHGLIIANQPDDFALLTTDGGATWHRRNSPIEHDEFQDGLEYLTIRTVFLRPDRVLGFGDVFGRGKLFLSEDGCKTWEELPLPFNRTINSMWFHDENNGLIASSNGIIRTLDGGETWIADRDEPDPTITDVQFLHAGMGWVVGEESTVFQTRDGGSSWQQIQLPVEGIRLQSVTFLTPNIGWISANNGALFSTRDGGMNWSHQDFTQKVEADSEVELERMKRVFPDLIKPFTVKRTQMISLEQGWMVGHQPFGRQYSSVYRTSDGGATWSRIGNAEEYSFRDFVFESPEVAYAIDWDRLYKTNDGGLTWEQVTLPMSTWNRMASLQRINNTTLVMRTNRSWLFYNLTDGTVVERPLPTGLNIVECHFTTLETGWLATRSMVYQSTDGGITWNPLIEENTIQADIRSILVLSEDQIWIAGTNGFVGALRNNNSPLFRAEDAVDEVRQRVNQIRSRLRE